MQTTYCKAGALAAALLMGSLLAGCGTGDTQTPKSTTPPAKAQPETTSKPAAPQAEAPPQPTVASHSDSEAEKERAAAEAERLAWERRIEEARQQVAGAHQAEASHARGGGDADFPATKSNPLAVPEIAPLPSPVPTPDLHASGSTQPPPPTPSTASKPSAENDPGEQAAQDSSCTVVKVYYATDRAPVDVANWRRSLRSGWPDLTLALAVFSLAILLYARRRPGRVALRRLGLSFVAFAMLAGGLTVAYRVWPDRAGRAVQRMYGNDRGEVELGTCEVSIAKDHQVGQMEGPSVLRLEFVQDPERHVVLQGVHLQSSDDFYGDLKSCVDQSAGKQAFVFIHGYNVGFETAARRTAQIAYDLKFDGAPIFYSWPSQEGLLAYTVDENNVAWTVPHLKEFLLSIAGRSGAQSVHLVAHSMGNRALTSAMRELSLELKRDCPRFHEVVLTAPDIDADVFCRDLAPAIVNMADRVTLYASSNDEALAASKAIHGYRRAGDSGEHVVIVPGVDTIDVSDIDSSLVGHCYYGSNRTVLADLFELIHGSKPPEQRKWLRAMQLGMMTYWKFFCNPATGAAKQATEVR